MNPNLAYKEAWDKFIDNNSMRVSPKDDVLSAEEKERYISNYGIEEYRISSLNDLCGQFDLSGKTVLEIGNSHFPREIIVGKIAAKNWVCVNNPWWDKSKPNAHFDSMTFYDLDKIDLEDAMRDDTYFICKGSPCDISNEFHGKFDFVFFYGNLSRVNNLPVTLDILYDCLKPEGVFYAASGPCWCAPYGSAFWIQQADLYFAKPKFLPPFVHLFYSRRQIYEMLLKEFGDKPHLEHWAQIIKCGGQDINQYLFEDYEYFLNNSKFKNKLVYPVGIAQIDEAARRKLEDMFPNYKTFGVNMFCIIAKKEMSSEAENTQGLCLTVKPRKLSEPWSFLKAIEPYVDESRELKGGNGVTPIQYLKLCAMLKPLPTVEELGDAMYAVLDSDDGEEGRKRIYEITHGKKTAEFLEALQKGLDTENLELTAKTAWVLMSAISIGSFYTKEIGMRLKLSCNLDDNVAIPLLKTISQRCFEAPAGQMTLLYLLSCLNNTSYFLSAASYVSVDNGDALTALYLINKAESYVVLSCMTWIYYLIKRVDPDIALGVYEGDLSEYICPVPFEVAPIFEFDFETRKAVFHACTCLAWNGIQYDSDSDGWNGKQMQLVRKTILDGSYIYCSRKLCTHMNSKQLLKKSEIKDKHLREIIENNSIVLKEGPKRVHLMYDYHCNLKCPSCRKEFRHLDAEQVQKLNDFSDTKILPLLNEAKHLSLSGVGEALSSPHSLHLLRSLTPEASPNLSIEIKTNGSNVTREKWESLGESGRLINHVTVSIDGIGETFEKLRYPAKWENLCRSMQFLSELKGAGNLKIIVVVMVLQADNYMQLTDLFKHCVSWNVNTFALVRITNWFGVGDDFSITKDICDPLHPNHGDLLREVERFKGYCEELKLKRDENPISKINIPNISHSGLSFLL